jgi:membrane protein
LVLLLWTYYSAQIFLFGAEITKSYSVIRGTRSTVQPSAFG